MIRALKAVMVVFWGAVLVALLSLLVPGLLGPASTVARLAGNVFVALVVIGVLGIVLLSVPGAGPLRARLGMEPGPRR